MHQAYGSEMCERTPLMLARNLSLLFEAMNEWIASTKEALYNEVFHSIISELEDKEASIASSIES